MGEQGVSSAEGGTARGATDSDSETLQSAGVLRRLRQAGLSPRRGLGQHFLHDPRLLRALAEDAGIGPRDPVFEIGTGPGTLTRELAKRAAHVLTVEVDAAMLRFARRELEGLKNITFLFADVLEKKARLAPVVREALVSLGPFVWVSNLPYGVATTLIVLLCEAPFAWSRATLMVQAEVADRLTAHPGHPAYGPVTALAAFWLAERKRGRRIPPGAFWPPPKVDSRVVLLSKGAPLGSEAEYPGYRTWVKRLFGARRKQLRALLKQSLGEERGLQALDRGGWDPRARPEELGPEDFLLLAREFPPGAPGPFST